MWNESGAPKSNVLTSGLLWRTANRSLSIQRLSQTSCFCSFVYPVSSFRLPLMMPSCTPGVTWTTDWRPLFQSSDYSPTWGWIPSLLYRYRTTECFWILHLLFSPWSYPTETSKTELYRDMLPLQDSCMESCAAFARQSFTEKCAAFAR
jgi:hypothetical protein